MPFFAIIEVDVDVGKIRSMSNHHGYPKIYGSYQRVIAIGSVSKEPVSSRFQFQVFETSGKQIPMKYEKRHAHVW